MSPARGFLAALARRSWVLVAVLPSLLLATAGGALGWLLFTEGGSGVGAATLQRASAGAVRYRVGARGRLFGPLERGATAGRRCRRRRAPSSSLHGIELEWRPTSLLDRLLEIESLKVARVELLLADTGATTPPADLHLPLALRYRCWIPAPLR
ncbi:MAG: hypothetical protein IPL72_17325 [Sulfuritalea sp.]|nr:hypothetical protein [Sulfuritalea sp.]